jgi:hypothetical protein
MRDMDDHEFKTLMEKLSAASAAGDQEAWGLVADEMELDAKDLDEMEVAIRERMRYLRRH